MENPFKRETQAQRIARKMRTGKGLVIKSAEGPRFAYSERALPGKPKQEASKQNPRTTLEVQGAGGEVIRHSVLVTPLVEQPLSTPGIEKDGPYASLRIVQADGTIAHLGVLAISLVEPTSTELGNPT